MLLRLFSGSGFLTGVLVFLFTFLLWIPGFFSETSWLEISHQQSMPFYRIFISWFGNNELAAKLTGFIFIVLQSLLLERLNAKFILIRKSTFLPALIFLALISFYSPSLKLSGSMFGSLGMILIINILFSTDKKDANTLLFFEAGLVLGIGSLFYARLLYFFPVIWIAQLILRPFYWREWVSPLIAVVLPYVFLTGILFLRGGELTRYPNLLMKNLNNFDNSFMFSTAGIIISLYVLFLVLIASAYILRVYQFNKIYIRNYFLFLFWLFLLSSVLFAFLTRFDSGIFYIAAIPVSFLLSNYFIHLRNNIVKNSLFTLLLVLFLLNGINNWFGWL